MNSISNELSADMENTRAHRRSGQINAAQSVSTPKPSTEPMPPHSGLAPSHHSLRRISILPPGASSGTAPLQRYVVLPQSQQKPGFWSGLRADLRVADDGCMAIKDGAVFTGGKQFYATQNVIDNAQQALEAVEAPYTVEPGSDSLAGTVPGSGGWLSRPKAVVLTEVVPRDKRKKADDPTGHGSTMMTQETCNEHGLDAMGVGARVKEQVRRIASITVGKGTELRNIGTAVGLGTGFDHLDKFNDAEAKNVIRESIVRLEQGNPDGEIKLNQMKQAYEDLPEKKRSQYAERFGINQFALPEVGEGVEIIRAGAKHGESEFSMHFAPVIASSGSDYVTLENHAKSPEKRQEDEAERIQNGTSTGTLDSAEASNAWYFRMYGPVKKHWFSPDDDQTYYGQHAAEGSIGNRNQTMAMVNHNNPAPQPELIERAPDNIADHKGDGMAAPVTPQIARSVTAHRGFAALPLYPGTEPRPSRPTNTFFDRSRR